ncbi:NUDIX domain-containing protein [Proteiniborus ethanoligenes]|uniref:NUDIX domain-containing protein n=1 Tax=Proteiniborus ethanoligenes TaxID=415015 RepID=A0A1H3QRE0_9FIRM|nr:NUDIX hydrolase [Proteiniborus ethanoligenes]TAH61125.1 MAG: NUDIX hydrolase [Gottschalkiaceae bacterium]SDZ15651.1 NUDIX domain-containing protein [Proteiniborus ethanoligenes]
MIFRSCAGGVVFHEDRVFIMKNDKNEWVLPKGKIRDGFLASETAIERVKEEAGLDVDIISTAGETSYEFYSFSRQQPVCNEITWFIMDSKDTSYEINKEYGILDGGFYNIDEAIDMITYSQDKSLVSLSYRKYVKLKEKETILA